MSWTEARRRVKRQEYARYYQTGHHRKGQSVTIPDDVRRVHSHTPCVRCGARAECHHRPWLGADRLEASC